MYVAGYEYVACFNRNQIAWYLFLSIVVLKEDGPILCLTANKHRDYSFPALKKICIKKYEPVLAYNFLFTRTK